MIPKEELTHSGNAPHIILTSKGVKGGHKEHFREGTGQFHLVKELHINIF